MDYKRSDFEMFYDLAIEDIPEGEIRDRLLKAKDNIVDLAHMEIEAFLAGFNQAYFIDTLNLTFEIVNCGYSNIAELHRQAAESLAAMVFQSYLPTFENDISNLFQQASLK